MQVPASSHVPTAISLGLISTFSLHGDRELITHQHEKVGKITKLANIYSLFKLKKILIFNIKSNFFNYFMFFFVFSSIQHEGDKF
jgi:hypothetical protein